MEAILSDRAARVQVLRDLLLEHLGDEFGGSSEGLTVAARAAKAGASTEQEDVTRPLVPAEIERRLLRAPAPGLWGGLA